MFAFKGFRLFVLAVLAAYSVAAPSDPLHVRLARPVVPSRDGFYKVPNDIDAATPGTILSHRVPPSPIAAFGISRVNLEATHQILYRTTDSHGNATATVATVLVPHNADMSKVLSYQVAEDAASVDCAPSYAFQLASATGPFLGTILTQLELLLIQAALEQGWVVIVPDFLGPNSAYLANRLAGQATLDGLRAAINSAPFTGISPNATLTMWGYSGGSVATNWAAELQPTYAPELSIAGAAVGGTVPIVNTVITTINKGPLAGFIPAGIVGLMSEYPELTEIIEKHLKPEYAKKFYSVRNQCLAANAVTFAFKDILEMFDIPDLILTNPTAQRILKENDVGTNTPQIPFFWYKPIIDEISPIEDTDELVKSYCSRGVSIEYVRDLISEHGSAAATNAAKALVWLRDRMDGKAIVAGCTTTSTFSSLLDPATFEIFPKFIIDSLLSLLAHKPVGPLID